jgi:RNA polymerase sigma factor (sigma-70 family)
VLIGEQRGGAMSKKEKKSKKTRYSQELNELLSEIFKILPKIVHKVCGRLNHPLSSIELDGYVQGILLLLIDRNCHTLRSFQHNSEITTWLFTIANRHIVHRLQMQQKLINLEELPGSAFAVEPEQESTVLTREREALLNSAVTTLTDHEQRLFHLLLQGLKTEEIAKDLKIEKRSVYSEKGSLIRKLRQTIQSV